MRSERLWASIGYFPNITHAQALIGLAKGSFHKAVGDGVEIAPKVFNAGPSVIEALFADQIDIAYVGPNPAINAYVRSKGMIVILAGAASGGARLITRGDSDIGKPEDFASKKIATPQLANTQDVAARGWLSSMKLKDQGGNVT